MRKNPWIVCALVICWKLFLLVFSAQPVPANDAFFYDGAVIHKLLHGGYCNPCVALAFPISGTKVFSAYPPLYQFVLLLWMAAFGTSALAAMALHLALVGGYMLILVAALKRLNVAPWIINFSSGFFLVLTFHDRPDSLAHFLGIASLYCWIRSLRILDPGTAQSSSRRYWAWMMALLVVLAFCTSLQIGAAYLGMITAGTALAWYFSGEKIPFAPLIAMFITPPILVMLIRIALPNAWQGFMENVRQTPFLTGWRTPQIPEILKIVRSIPGILLIALMLPLSFFRSRQASASDAAHRYQIVLLPVFLVALGISLASLCMISANTVGIGTYAQPLLVALFLAILVPSFAGKPWLHLQVACLTLAMLLGAVRAIGMTTWGLACTRDFGYSKANRTLDAELVGCAQGYTVVMSSAFLYDAAKYTHINAIHCDWLEKAGGDSLSLDVKGLFKQKPQKLILTQFDYYRRYEAVLAEAKKNPVLQNIEVINTAKTRAPDSYKSLQKVLQHVSWAPVIVNLTWRE